MAPLTRGTAVAGIVLLSLVLGALGCTDAELRCIAGDCAEKQLAVVDNVVLTQGKFCTASPNTSTYPYKVLLVVDTSESTLFTDPANINGRYNALLKVLNDPKYVNNPYIEFAVMSFATYATAQQPVFTSNHQLLLKAIAPLNDAHSRGTQGQTDYLEALRLASKIIADDVSQSNPAQRAYLQYDVQWLSDGNPEVNPDPTCGPCRPTDPSLLAHCVEDRPTVQRATEQFIDLKNQLGVYDIRLSTIFLDRQFNSVCSPLFTYDPDRWSPGNVYLADMAKTGNGTATVFTNAADLEFRINVQTITRRYVQNSFFLVNYSRVIEGDELVPDSDQDGISDAAEAAFGTDPTKPRSDAKSMCGDLARARSSDNPNQCLMACMPGGKAINGVLTPIQDMDGDFLLNCEEASILSNPNVLDSDNDNLTDDIELRFNTSPIDFTDNRLDKDRDGVYDYDEIMLGLNPDSPQTSRALAYDYVPLQTATGDAARGVTCYNFQVRNVQLAATQESSVSQKGENRLCALVIQHPVDNPNGQPTVSRACKSANFQIDANQKAIKDPPDGIVQFEDTDFKVVMCGDSSCKPDSTVTASGKLLVPGEPDLDLSQPQPMEPQTSAGQQDSGEQAVLPEPAPAATRRAEDEPQEGASPEPGDPAP